MKKQIKILLAYIILLSLLIEVSFTYPEKDKKPKGNNPVCFEISLSDTSHLHIAGKYRFLTIDGKTGFQPLSLNTKAFITTKIHQKEKGSISFWYSPLEDLDFFPNAGNRMNEDKHAFHYPLISDVFPPNDANQMNFGIFWYNHDPQILAKFASGGIWSKLDYSLPPYVTIEKIPMRPGIWYQATMTWDKPAHKINFYVNGILMAYNHEADGFMAANDTLYIGCPMILIRELKLTDQVIPEKVIKESYQKNKSTTNRDVDKEIARLTTPSFQQVDLLEPDDRWKKSYTCSFLNKDDINGWYFQTDESYLDSMIVKITDEGLYFKTPDKIDNATRLTLWGPEVFEGDQCLELEFRLESPKGLALVVICASGMGREDFIEDHGLQMTGRMSPILGSTRNYHWEFMRRVNVIRTDMETQAVYKNPFGKHLYWGVIPKLEQGIWYKLRLIKSGNHIQGSIDGNVVFDIIDDPNSHSGPSYNFGRVGIRQMYHTGITYRNLVVYEKRD